MRKIAVALVLLLSACASPESQLQAGLVKAGLPEKLATCMAQRMAPKLSLTQLMRLRSLSKVGKLDPEKANVEQFLHQVRALEDPEIWTITSKAAFHCSLGLH